MRGRLAAWMRQTDDPLLDGDVPAPTGAKVNDPDSYSPSGKLLPARGRKTAAKRRRRA